MKTERDLEAARPGTIIEWPADAKIPKGWERADHTVRQVDGVVQPIRIRKI